MKDLRRFSFFLFVFFFCFRLSAQNTDFTASIDAEEVLEGNYFQITFSLQNARGSSFAPPSFRDFTVMGGPNSSSQMSIINGRTTQSMSYSYTLMPKNPGTFTINSATIKVGSNTLKSNKVNVKILKGEEKKKLKGEIKEEDIFIELELSDTTAYVGQQVVLKYVIYTSIDIRSYNFIKESEYKGFYVEELQNYREKAAKVVRGGKQYLRQTLKAISLFPQQTGKAEIGSSIVNLGIAIKSQRPSFFFSTSMRSERLSTPAKTINILPLPDGAPESFSGAIGNYRMSCFIDKKNISLDGAITIAMNVEGDGDSRFVGPPKQSISGFEIYEPNLLNEESRYANGKIRSTKNFEYLLVPQIKGQHIITPEFSYYNIDSNMYLTIRGSTYSVRVLGGNGKRIISTEDLESRLAPIATVIKLYKPANPIFSPLHVGFLGFCGFAFIILSGVKWRKEQHAKIDPNILKSRKAHKIAIRNLAISKGHLDDQKIKEFYSAMAESLFSYISDKIHIPTSQISKDTLVELFESHRLSEQMAKTLSRIIERSEMAIYAGFAPEKAAEDYETSKKLIVDIENTLSQYSN